MVVATGLDFFEASGEALPDSFLANGVSVAAFEFIAALVELVPSGAFDCD